jgi:hypothetical protein
MSSFEKERTALGFAVEGYAPGGARRCQWLGPKLLRLGACQLKKADVAADAMMALQNHAEHDAREAVQFLKQMYEPHRLRYRRTPQFRIVRL